MHYINVLFTFILVAITFNVPPVINNLKIATFNLHGFSQSSQYLKESIQTHGGIWLVQEHWLSEQQLHQLQQLNCQYVARSGMEDALSSGVFRGRPFGGVALCWSPDLNHVIVPVTNYKHKRIAAVEVKTQNRNILLVTVYMPFFNGSSRAQCMNETIDAISMMEIMLSDYPDHDIVIGGDLNTELKGESPFDTLWNGFCTKYSLSCCDTLVSSIHHTYRHETLNQSKFNDHFLVSQDILDNGAINKHFILDDGHNPSDHLPLLLEITTNLSSTTAFSSDQTRRPRIDWKNVTEQNIADYSSRLQSLLLQHQSPSFSFACESTCHCDNDICKEEIQKEYDFIRSCIINASNQLPRKRSAGVAKDWWSPELSRLKSQSIDIQSLWIQEGRPRHGPIFNERLRVRAVYKNAIRCAKKAPKTAAWNRLHATLADEDSDAFWKTWKSIHGKDKSRPTPVVEGQSSREGIANVFKDAFKKNSTPNNATKVAELDAKFHAKYGEYATQHADKCNCSDYTFSFEDIFDAVCGMKKGKCPDDDELYAEHFMHAPFILYIKLATLFNQMMTHSFVPIQFKSGTIIPLIKDKSGSTCDVNNYRGITISPIASKVFEHVLKNKFAHHLGTSFYQFGFKKGKSTMHALFCLRETINYYISHGSHVFCSFLDASKAFDRLVHSGLFIKLMQRGFPKSFLDILIYWYDGLVCRVRWDGVLSNWFNITAGVRQGGILSPDLYSIYVDDLISVLQSSGIGCYVAKTFAAALFYADDMCVLAPSVNGLQKMLDLCARYCDEWDIRLNPKKTKNMWFGKKINLSHRLHMAGAPIEWVTQWKYLGVTLQNDKVFNCSVTEKVRSFYRALNSILRIEGRSDDMILLRLLETHCIPILTYGVEAIHVTNRDEKRPLRVAYNSVYRKLFNYRTYESVTALQHSLGRKTWEELIESRNTNFRVRAQSCPEDSLIRAFC